MCEHRVRGGGGELDALDDVPFGGADSEEEEGEPGMFIFAY